MADFAVERDLLGKGYRSVVGVDEVGRGCLFGPVVAAAVSFSSGTYTGTPPAWMSDIDDSKRLVPAKREKLALLILREADMAGVGLASSREIDAMNILRATWLAMSRAVSSLPAPPGFLLVDGSPVRDIKYPQMGLRRGDVSSLSIAAASIVAKVFRDGLMRMADPLHSGYGIARNKGYGTPEHYRGLGENGPTSQHRRSFFLGPACGDAGVMNTVQTERASKRR